MKQIINLLKASIKSIFKNRMRSLLTSLGIIIGVCAVIVMVGIGEGSSQKIEEHIASLGTDLLILHPGPSRRSGVSRGAGTGERFTLKDYEELKERVSLIKAISPMVRSSGQIIGGDGN